MKRVEKKKNYQKAPFSPSSLHTFPLSRAACVVVRRRRRVFQRKEGDGTHKGSPELVRQRPALAAEEGVGASSLGQQWAEEDDRRGDAGGAGDGHLRKTQDQLRQDEGEKREKSVQPHTHSRAERRRTPHDGKCRTCTRAQMFDKPRSCPARAPPQPTLK